MNAASKIKYKKSAVKYSSKIFLNRPWTLDYQKPCKEPGEQCTVVFELIVTEPANECVWMGGGGFHKPHPSQ